MNKNENKNFLLTKFVNPVQKGEQFAISLRKQSRQAKLKCLRQKRVLQTVQVPINQPKQKPVELLKSIQQDLKQKVPDVGAKLAALNTEIQRRARGASSFKLLRKMVSHGIIKTLGKVIELTAANQFAIGQILEIMVTLSSIEQPEEVHTMDPIEVNYTKIVFSWECMELLSEQNDQNLFESLVEAVLAILDGPEAQDFRIQNLFILIGNFSSDGVSTQKAVANSSRVHAIISKLLLPNLDILESISWGISQILSYEDKYDAKLISKEIKKDNFKLFWQYASHLLTIIASFQPQPEQISQLLGIHVNIIQLFTNLLTLSKYGRKTLAQKALSPIYKTQLEPMLYHQLNSAENQVNSLHLVDLLQDHIQDEQMMLCITQIVQMHISAENVSTDLNVQICLKILCKSPNVSQELQAIVYDSNVIQMYYCRALGRSPKIVYQWLVLMQKVLQHQKSNYSLMMNICSQVLKLQMEVEKPNSQQQHQVVWQALNLIQIGIESVPITNGDQLRVLVDDIIQKYETLPVVKPFDVFDKAMSLFHLLKTQGPEDDDMVAEEDGDEQIATFNI